MFSAHPIGFIHSPYRESSAIPKGLGARHDAEGVIELLREFEPGLADIDGFSHLFVLWQFDRADGFDLIAHPPADAGRPHGVFATRSPRRQGPSLHVRGVDMLDGTPVLDIKPYLSSIASDKLRRGWLAEAEERKKA
jgi:tRNA-Thr(GGU) m(6)t(6)A37 methyltransferase TsaA